MTKVITIGAIRVQESISTTDQSAMYAIWNKRLHNVVLKDYKLAIEHCEAAIAANDKYIDHAYMVKGLHLDMMGKFRRSDPTKGN